VASTDMANTDVKRLDGWPERLMAVLSEEMAASYAPGEHDCFVLACRVVEAQTGVRPYAAVRYGSDAGAVKAMKRLGFARLGDAMAAILPERAAGAAMRGDIAVVATDTLAGDTLGVVIDGVILLRVGDRFERLPLGDARLILGVG
jgi:hypothetical protein